jgi:hypothetical protein
VEISRRGRLSSNCQNLPETGLLQKHQTKRRRPILLFASALGPALPLAATFLKPYLVKFHGNPLGIRGRHHPYRDKEAKKSAKIWPRFAAFPK